MGRKINSVDISSHKQAKYHMRGLDMAEKRKP